MEEHKVVGKEDKPSAQKNSPSTTPILSATAVKNPQTEPAAKIADAPTTDAAPVAPKPAKTAKPVLSDQPPPLKDNEVYSCLIFFKCYYYAI